MTESALPDGRALLLSDSEDVSIMLCEEDHVRIQVILPGLSPEEAYKKASEIVKYPLHLGVTEAGTKYKGIIKSAAGIGGLLLNGIGDTIRVSLTDNPVEEIKAAKDILKSIGLKNSGVNIVSCPTCGRTKIDLISLANRVEKALEDCDKNITVAVMGCVVNGPGEAKEADIGIAGGDGCGIIFKKGEILKKVDENKLFDALMLEIKGM